ncbi:MAG: adenylate/guanylate cyclase domain-containing protein, partial [Acidimicrobiia bacterium]|nr:adenylate/guanylate cyclase domain-containing protein [Acidimicrobiia bacterium]
MLFADLAGYTPFSEHSDPEEVRAFLMAYFDRCREVIERFGGTVDKFIGDAVMAVWGAVIANEDDAERAVRAGLELIDSVAKLAADSGAPEMAVRVGVHTGEAAVGPGGNQMGLVAGDMVNTASRLQSVAEPGTLLVGEGTYLATSRAIAFEAMGETALKGKQLTVPAYRALRVVAERGGRGRAEALEPPFVGRTDEFRLLKDLLASVGRDGRSRMVSMIGEAGIGKSRLIWEYLKYIDGLLETIHWHEGRSPAYGDGVTFWAVGEMIKSRAGIAATDTHDVARTRLAESVATHIEDPADQSWAEPRLAALLGLGSSPTGERAELFAAVRSFFAGVARAGTTVMVFEDLHWADDGLLDFVEELTDWWRDTPILVITMARPDLFERRPGFGAGNQGLVSLHLAPMTPAEMRSLIEGTVPGLPESAVTAIVERAAGIPLYAVEMLRMLIAQGDVAEIEGKYQMVVDLTTLAVPESLQAVIGARLDRLEADDRSLLQDAAVLGQAFTLDGLAFVTGTSEAHLEPRLHGLARRDLIEPVRDPRSPERGQYRFLQGLIRDVAVGRMSRDLRSTRHLRAAEYFEGLLDPELSVVVASHYLEALKAIPGGSESDRIRTKAIDSMMAAVDRAADLHGHAQVLSICEQALALAETPDRRAPFWEKMSEAATRLADRELAERDGNLALDHYQSSGDDAGVNRMTRKLAFTYVEENVPARAVDLLGPHLEGRANLRVDPELARAAGVFARALLLTNREDEAVVAADRALAAAEALGLMPTIVDALITKATALGHPGRRVEARILLEGAIGVADRHGLSHAGMRARNNLAHFFAVADPIVALQATTEAYEIAKRTGDRSMALFLAANLIGSLAIRAQFEQIESVLAEPILADPPARYRG